jgi:hypothetical protein
LREQELRRGYRLARIANRWSVIAPHGGVVARGEEDCLRFIDQHGLAP